jgi:CheY-like chemotaxis protein
MNLETINILLADDDVDDCIFFRMALEGLLLSLNLTIVNDGDQLMEYLIENSCQLPDVLFLDINMPRKNGLECLSEIKQDIRLQNLPVVILSTSCSAEKINQAFKIGGHIYIHKPRDFGQLKQVISHALPIAVNHEFSKGPVKYILNA